MEGLVAQSNYEGLVFKDPVECANQWATFLKVDQHCDVVICLSHLGWKGEEGDEHLIPATRNIDLVLGGHSHSYFDEPVFYKNLDGEEIPLQQMGKNARFVGHIEMTFEKE
jgi:5'-nucleotidase